MAAPIPVIVFFFLLVLCAVSSSSSPLEPGDDGSDIRVLFAEKQIHLSGLISRVTLTLEVENAATAASDASQFLLAFKPWEVEHLAIVKATRVEGKHSKKSYEPLSVQDHADLLAIKNGPRLYSVLLSTHLKPGESTTLEVVYVLTHVLDPYPAKSVISGSSASQQLVYYRDTAVLISPYHVLEQVTYINMPRDRLDTYTVVDPTSVAGAEIKYGPYYNQLPVTDLPIHLHYENRPFVVFEKLERKVYIPRGGLIKVTDHYRMRHDGAWYKRIFTRPECPRIWPTAHTLLSSNKDQIYRNLIQGPRYGWDCTFTIAYGLPLEDFLFLSQDGRTYTNLTFGVPVLDTLVEDFTTTSWPQPEDRGVRSHAFSSNSPQSCSILHVLLPEGSKNPQITVPFPVKTIFKGTYWERFWALLQCDDEMVQPAGQTFETSYSNVDGRAMVVLKKKKLVAEHNVPFQVYYESSSIFMLTGLPLTLWSAAIVVLFIGGCISYVCYESNPILMLTNPLTLLSVCIAACVIYFYLT